MMLDRTGNAQIADRRDIALPSQDEARAALERIISSSEFIASPHLAAFLKFSVEKSLAGEGHTIKAYSVATGVLGRPPTFDPQADPIVRVEATRLRRALERYYLHEGARDPVLIDIPRGRYIAYFSYRNEIASAQAAGSSYDNADDALFGHPDEMSTPRHSSPSLHMLMAWRSMNRSERRSIAVFAFALIGAVMTWTIMPMINDGKKPLEQALMLQPATEPQADAADKLVTRSIATLDQPRQRAIFATLQLSPFDSYSDKPEHEELSHRITHLIAERAPDFDGIPVIDPDGPMAAEPPSDHLYALMGTILQESENPEHVEISVRLVQRPSYEIVWAKSYTSKSAISLFDAELRSIRDDIVQSITGLYGAIRVDDARRHIEEKMTSTPCQLCLAESDMALRTRDPERIAKAISCLKTMADKSPNDALVFKQLAALHLADPKTAADRVASLQSAQRELETALSLAPADVNAQMKLESLRTGGR